MGGGGAGGGARVRHLRLPGARGRRGISLPARQLGKWKATVQYFAVGAVLFPPTADAVGLQQVVLWSAVGITLLSGFDILRRGWQETKAVSDEV